MEFNYKINGLDFILRCHCYSVIIHLSNINEVEVHSVGLGLGLDLLECNYA